MNRGPSRCRRSGSMWRRCNLRRSGLHTRPASTRSLLPDSASRGRRVLQHICRGASSTNLTSEELAPMVDGWTVNGWVESQAVPYNTISGWDPDHCESTTAMLHSPCIRSFGHCIKGTGPLLTSQGLSCHWTTNTCSNPYGCRTFLRGSFLGVCSRRACRAVLTRSLTPQHGLLKKPGWLSWTW